jgi:hypothetical protein
MFGHAVALTGEVVNVEVLGQAHRLGQFVGGGPGVETTHRLIPQELQGVSVALRTLVVLVATDERGSVGADQVRSPTLSETINAGQQHPGIAVLLTANRKDVEQGRPDQVVHAQVELFEEEGDRVVAVARRLIDLHSQSGDRDLVPVVEFSSDRSMPGGERGVIGGTKVETESVVNQGVGTVAREEQAELLADPSGVGRGDLGGDSTAVERDAAVSVDR